MYGGGFDNNASFPGGGFDGNAAFSGGGFDGNAAFSGGGFMPSQATQAPDYSSSSKNRDVRTLLPLTLKQLNCVSTTGESNFTVDGVDINTVVIVGRVCNTENRLTQFDFVVDDGTGRIDCIRWVHERQDSDEVEVISLGMYVRVHGILKSLQGRRSLNVFSVRPVTDFNEVVHHFIECMYVHLHNSKSLAAANTAKPSMTYPPMPIPQTGYQSGVTNHSSGQHNGSQSITQMVMNFLNQPAHLASEAGVRCDIISQQLKIPLDKIREALEVLSNDGFVYSTMDENSYKSTANA